jgi:outer membrane protein OmpA-like peptidoglycan-associated protein
MKKHLLTAIFFLFCANFIFAQKWELRKANNLFEKRAYLDAADIYSRSEKNQETLKNLGDSYYFNTNMKKASKWYGELVNNFGVDLDNTYLFRYAQSLKGIKKYEEADIWMAKYTAAQTISNKKLISEIDANVPYVYELKSSEINAEVSDFGPAYYGEDKIIFASSRNPKAKNYRWNDQAYLDLYTAEINNDGSLTNPQLLNGYVNTKKHEASAAVSKDGNTMYFSRTNYTDGKRGKDENKVTHLKIYSAKLVDSVWKNIKELPFNDISYSTYHPALNYDETKLYFVSDMPGTIGGMDIFEVDINKDGSYGNPRNLGPKVNTKKREQFPYMSEYNTLYFASNGHLGLGNLDLFSSQIEENKFLKPKNLGSSINSSLDDFSLIINEKTDKGYFTSNKENNDDNIYEFTREEYIKPIYMVEGFVTDKKTGKILSGSLVTLMDDNNNVLADTIVKADGKYIFKLDPNEKYMVRGTRKLYNPYDVKFSTDTQGKISHDIILDLELYSDKEENIVASTDGSTQVKINKIYFDFDKWSIRTDAAKELDVLVDVMKKYPDMAIEVSAHTDARGSSDYNLELSHKRAKSTLDYLVSQGIALERLKSIGYGEMQPLNNCANGCSEKEYDINRRCQFKLLN